MTRSRSAQEGFGIIVVALLFTAFSVAAAVALDRSNIQIEQNRQKQVEAQLQRLNIAIAKFARYGDHTLPCPASWLRLTTDGNFGASEPVATSVCKGASDESAGANGYVSVAGTGHKLLIGMVPVKALIPYGVSFSDAFDPWGSRILYVVHRDLTNTATPAEIAAAVTAQRPNVSDYLTGEVISPAPDVVLVSFGRDRMGGRLRQQASLTSPSIACAGADRRNTNCLYNSRNFLRGPLMTSARATTTNYFDDTISTLRYMP